MSRTKFLISTRAGRLLSIFWLGCAAALVGRFALEVRAPRTRTMFTRLGEHYDSLVVLPRDFSMSGPSRPLLVFLHGAGEVPGNLDDLRTANPVTYGAATVPEEDFPFLLLCPKLNDRVWEPDQVIAFLDDFLDSDPVGRTVDRDRIYLTGFSLGGYGTWQTGACFPDRFAAVVPVAGDSDPAWAGRFGSLPVWAFHGAEDRVVSPVGSVETIGAIRELRGDTDDIRLTLYPDAPHGIAGTVYHDGELYRWLLKQSLKKETSH